MLREIRCNLGGRVFAYLSACLKSKPQPCWDKVAGWDRTRKLQGGSISTHHKTSMLTCHSLLSGPNDRLSWVSVAAKRSPEVESSLFTAGNYFCSCPSALNKQRATLSTRGSNGFVLLIGYLSWFPGGWFPGFLWTPDGSRARCLSRYG